MKIQFSWISQKFRLLSDSSFHSRMSRAKTIKPTFIWHAHAEKCVWLSKWAIQQLFIWHILFCTQGINIIIIIIITSGSSSSTRSRSNNSGNMKLFEMRAYIRHSIRMAEWHICCSFQCVVVHTWKPFLSLTGWHMHCHHNPFLTFILQIDLETMFCSRIKKFIEIHRNSWKTFYVKLFAFGRITLQHYTQNWFNPICAELWFDVTVLRYNSIQLYNTHRHTSTSIPCTVSRIAGIIMDRETQLTLSNSIPSHSTPLWPPILHAILILAVVLCLFSHPTFRINE